MRGGKRTGAGRPGGSGKFGEPTQAVRIPKSRVAQVLKWMECRLPFFQCAVAAGFPTAAEEEVEAELDLNELLIKRPTATFFVRVQGASMIGAGIHDGDILVVDRSLTAVDGKVVIAAVNGELTVKRLYRKGKTVRLLPENEDFEPIDITEETDLHIWGVVTNVIHAL